jgi:hypothetical protein
VHSHVVGRAYLGACEGAIFEHLQWRVLCVLQQRSKTVATVTSLKRVCLSFKAARQRAGKMSPAKMHLSYGDVLSNIPPTLSKVWFIET